MVADQPGTTRDVVDIPFSIGEGPEARHYVLMDTAGLRKPSKSASAADRLSQFRAGDGVARADVVVLLVDASAGPTADDKRVGGLIMEKKKGCVVLVSKWDLAGMSEREFREELSRGLPFMRHCPVVIASVKTGRGIRESVSVIDHVAAQTRLTLTTGLLSRALLDAWRRIKPRAVAGRRLHVFYSVQVGVAPITVRVFVNDPKLVDDSYRSYLVKALRGKFGLEGAPVLLQFRPRR